MTRRWAGTDQLVRYLLLVAVLVPVTILFVQVRQAAGEKVSFAEKERHGVAYLAGLWQVTLALTDAQAAAVAGRAPDSEKLDRAVAGTGEIDQRYGAELRTQERWSGLRAKIEALRGRNLADSSAAYDAYTEVTDLLLALYGRIRENSELIRDPDGDAYYLEDGGAEELPEAVVAAGRLADLAVIAPSRPQSARTETVATLTVARSAVTDPAGDLTDDLRSAVDGTKSRTLSGNLLNQVDLFQRGIDQLAAASRPAGDQAIPPAGPLTSARAGIQKTVADLGPTVFRELDTLLADRIDDLNGQRLRALGTYLLAVLLLLAPIAVRFLPRRSSRRPSEVEPVVQQREWETSGVAR